jgi:glycerophosphoryl diester phosphodiesterase
MKLVAHRGHGGPENTVEAAQRAYRLPAFAAVEVDVRLTADQVLVLAHDDMIGDCVVRDCSLAQLRQKRPELATLPEVLQLHRAQPGGEKELVLDLKHRDVVAPLAALLAPPAEMERVLLIAFDHDIIDALQPQLPGMRMLYLLEAGDDVAAAVQRVRRTGVAGLDLDVKLLPQVRPEWRLLFPLWICWCDQEFDTPQLLRHTRQQYPWLQRYTTDLAHISV